MHADRQEPEQRSGLEYLPFVAFQDIPQPLVSESRQVAAERCREHRERTGHAMMELTQHKRYRRILSKYLSVIHSRLSSMTLEHSLGGEAHADIAGQDVHPSRR